MSQDFSLFGWMLPEQEMDVLIVPVIISLGRICHSFRILSYRNQVGFRNV